MIANGKVLKYGDNVDTDVIIPARYLNSFDAKELASHVMVDLDPTFVDRLEPGDTIEVEIPEPVAVDIQPTEMDLEIVYEDEDVLVINKPKGLVVHPAAGHQDAKLWQI